MTCRVLQGNCRALLKTLPDKSVHTVVTSPPYWGLRDYGVADQIGLEHSPEAWVTEIVGVFSEVWRVLRDDGTVWLNLGDSFASQGGHSAQGETSARVGRSNVDVQNAIRGFRPGLLPSGIKSGDLIGLPWMVAFALRASGWWLRQDNIWAKRNCMPESTRSRTTRAHEYVFQLAKSGKPLFWTHRDHAGTRAQPEPDYRWVHRKTGEERDSDPGEDPAWRRINLWEGHNYFYDATAIEEDGEVAAGTRAAKGSVERAKQANGRPPEYAVYTGKRNKRSVWWVATQPFTESHFATMPPAIAETCILAGSSERGCCAACGAPWWRVESARAIAEGRESGNKQRTPGEDVIEGASHVGRGFPWQPPAAVTTGWRPTCACPAADPVPCTILDPFAGAFTTCLVADRLQRDAIGMELSEDYCEIARRRLIGDAPLLAQLSA